MSKLCCNSNYINELLQDLYNNYFSLSNEMKKLLEEQIKEKMHVDEVGNSVDEIKKKFFLLYNQCEDKNISNNNILEGLKNDKTGEKEKILSRIDQLKNISSSLKNNIEQLQQAKIYINEKNDVLDNLEFQIKQTISNIFYQEDTNMNTIKKINNIVQEYVKKR